MLIKRFTVAVVLVLLSCWATGGRAQFPPSGTRPSGTRPSGTRAIDRPSKRPAMRQAMTAPQLRQPMYNGPNPYSRLHRRRSVRDYSWIYIDAPKAREVKVHDLLTIIVDEKSEVTMNSRYNRQRNGTLKAQLRDFVRFGETGNLTNAATGTPSINATLQSRLQSNGQLTDQEGIRYRIAATVVDVRPNGNVVLEARKTIRTNRDVWEYSLTGVLRSSDINRDNTALSENIANLDIVKRQRGKVYDSTKRPWGILLYDWFWPF